MKIATAPGSWGIEPPPRSTDAPWERVLNEIAEAGFDGSELGPLGYYPTTPADLCAEFARRGLELPAGFVMESLTGDREALIDVAKQTCRTIAPAGGSVLVLIDALDPGRSLTAGNGRDAVRLEDAQWERLVGAVDEVSNVALEAGLRVAFHPHAGTRVEFRDEIDRLLSAVDIGLCVDTGHAYYAGIEPVDLISSYGARVAHVHLKDVDYATLERCRSANLSFEDSVAAGVFTPLGDGALDLAGVAVALDRAGYQGWATYEQDRTQNTIDRALDESRRSLLHARTIGF